MIFLSENTKKNTKNTTLFAWGFAQSSNTTCSKKLKVRAVRRDWDGGHCSHMPDPKKTYSRWSIKSSFRRHWNYGWDWGNYQQGRRPYFRLMKYVLLFGSMKDSYCLGTGKWCQITHLIFILYKELKWPLGPLKNAFHVLLKVHSVVSTMMAVRHHHGASRDDKPWFFQKKDLHTWIVDIYVMINWKVHHHGRWTSHFSIPISGICRILFCRFWQLGISPCCFGALGYQIIRQFHIGFP